MRCVRFASPFSFRHFGVCHVAFGFCDDRYGTSVSAFGSLRLAGLLTPIALVAPRVACVHKGTDVTPTRRTQYKTCCMIRFQTMNEFSPIIEGDKREAAVKMSLCFTGLGPRVGDRETVNVSE